MVFKYIKKGIDAYKKNTFQLIAGSALITLITLGFIGFGMLPVVFGLMTELDLASIGFSAIFILLAIVLSFALQGGYVKIIKDSFSGKANVNTMIKTAKEKFWTLVFANAIKGLLSVLVIILIFYGLTLFMPVADEASALYIVILLASVFIGSLFLIFFTFVDQAVVLDNKRAFESIKYSFKIVKKNYLTVFALFIIMTVISLLVSLIPIVGSFIASIVISPIMLASLTAFYIDRKK